MNNDNADRNTAPYRLWFAGRAEYYNSLLPAMERRKAIMSVIRDTDSVHIEQRTSDGWDYFNAERFLEGLAVLLAPAE
jgi:hypothetical protein